MKSQTELATLKFYLFQFFELVNRCQKKFNIILELTARDF